MKFYPLSLAALAGVVVSSPLYLENELERRDNCTQYTSVAAGSVCYHTPSDCTATYLVKSGDTCDSIAALYNNFTISQFYLWNPDVTTNCMGLQAFVPVCINTPWYKYTPPVQPPAGTVESKDRVPVPQMFPVSTACNKFELAGAGYRVDTMVKQNNITISDFISWNGWVVDKSNPIAWEGYWVCVGVDPHW